MRRRPRPGAAPRTGGLSAVAATARETQGARRGVGGGQPQHAERDRERGDRPDARATVHARIEAQARARAGRGRRALCRALELCDAVPHAEAPARVDRAEILARAAAATAWSGAPAPAIELVDATIALVDEGREPARAGLLHERRRFYVRWERQFVAGGMALYARAWPGSRRSPNPSFPYGQAVAPLILTGAGLAIAIGLYPPDSTSRRSR
jgi:hypothetical protein